MKDLQVDLYSTFDEPYPFKRTDSEEILLIYPAVVKDFFVFHYFADVLLVDKNSIPDVKIIQMPYLEYIIKESNAENNYILKLYALLCIVFREEKLDFDYSFDEKGKVHLIINNSTYNHRDFEDIRQIIVQQNLLEIPDDTIEKAIRDRMQEAEELRRKIKGIKAPSLEDNLISLSVATGIPIEKIYEMSIRKFRKSIERVDHKLHYEIYLAASLSGFVEFKDKSAIKHWMSDLSKSSLDGMIPYEEFEGKVSGAT